MCPGDLEKILKKLPFKTANELLVGVKTIDDAAVYAVSGGLAIVQTVDFITPVVDDPYLFGQIAAANAMSDIYAMGADPRVALNVVAFPTSLGIEVLEEILRGGRDKVEEAGALLVGGHTVEDEEPKYGLAVTAVANEDEITPNSGAKSGDVLVLTKPLGMGILCTALKGKFLTEEDMKEAIESARTLNRGAKDAAKAAGAKCVTDVTGFGLLGHLSEMLEASSVSAKIHTSEVSIYPRTEEFSGMGLCPAKLSENRDFFEKKVVFDEEVKDVFSDILFDPETSGGLLISVASGKAEELVEILKEKKTPAASIIGEVKEGTPGSIHVTI